MKVPSLDYLALLHSLAEHGVEFIIVGGVPAVLHGAPVTTFDLDSVHSRTPDNIGRLLSALQHLDAYYRGKGDLRLKLGFQSQMLTNSEGPKGSVMAST